MIENRQSLVNVRIIIGISGTSELAVVYDALPVRLFV